MSTPTIPPQGQPVPGPLPSLPSGTGQAPSLPSTLLTQLQSGGQVQAEVTARPQTGQLVVTTPQGPVTLQTPLVLPQGTPVVLTLLQGGSPPTLTIQPRLPTAPAPLPGGAGLPGAGNGGNAAVQSGSGTATGSITTSQTLGSLVTATVLRPGSPAATSPTGGSVPPAAQGPVPPGIPSTVSSPPLSTSLPGAATPTAGSSLSALQAGQQLPLRIVGLQLPGQVLTPLAGAPAPGLAGTVLSVQGNLAQVQTPAGLLSFVTHSSLPPGTQLQFSLEGQILPPLAGTGGAMPDAMGALRWQGLQEAVALLQAGNPAAAQQVMQLLPGPGPQLGTTLLFFLSALRGGGIENWLGRDLPRTLERARAGLGDRLANDFRLMSGRAVDPTGQEWRSFQIPVQVENEIERIRLYLRDPPEQDGGKKDDDPDEGAAGQRFVIEVNFSRLGAFQFDGLARENRVDLMIRTHAAMAEAMRAEIDALYHNTLSALGFMGSLSFQVVGSFGFQPAGDTHIAHDGVTI